MTIYRGGLEGGPAGDVGLGALALVLRYAYATTPDLDALLGREATDLEHLEHFAAFLAGHGRPTVDVNTGGRL